MPTLHTIVLEPWLWLGGSVLVAMLWTNLAWLFSPWAESERSTAEPVSLPERTVHHLANWRFAPGLFQALRLLYHVGLPAAAFFWGRDAVVSRFLGLQSLVLPTQAGTGVSIDANWSAWAHDLGWAGALALGAGALLILSSITYRRAVPDSERTARSSEALGWRSAREALYHEVHWAFYRNAPIVAFGLYWGTWAGLAVAALEAVINPTWRRQVSDPDHTWHALSQGAMAVLSSMLFLHTQNLWLGLLLHWGISWVIRTYAPPPTLSNPAESPHRA